MAVFKKWLESLNKMATPLVMRAERLTPTWLAVQPGAEAVRVPVKDISTSGVYLLTEKRWDLGQEFPLELLGEGFGKEVDPELHVAARARVVRHGEDGVAFSFVLPEALDPKLWETLINTAFLMSDYNHIVLAFRMLRTVLILCRLCPSSTKEVMAVLRGELDGPRTDAAIEIVGRAEEFLRLHDNAHGLQAHPGLVARILREGSWATDEVSRDLWAGLLVASCEANGAGESNHEYIDLMIHLTPTQARILVAGCTKAKEQMGGHMNAPLPTVLATPEEMIHITGLYDLSRIATDMAYLFHNGLMEELFDFSSYIPTESFRITPSALGMKLFLACTAQSGSSAEEHA